jgi:hypothetical protein
MTTLTDVSHGILLRKHAIISPQITKVDARGLVKIIGPAAFNPTAMHRSIRSNKTESDF